MSKKNMSIKDRNDYLSILFFFIGVALCIFWRNTYNYSIIGVMIIVSSMHMLFKCRNSQMLLLLFSIICYINISSAVLDCIYHGTLSNSYQYVLRNSASGLSYAKSMLLTTIIIDLCINKSYIDRTKNNKLSDMLIYHDNNVLISIGFVIVSIFIILTQFTGSGGAGGYKSNDNVLYEYVILFVLLGMYYSKGKNINNIFYLFIGLIHALKGIINGDRSSAFMMLLLLFIWFFSKIISVSRMILFSFAGIIAANTISVLRGAVMNLDVMIHSLIKRGPLFFFSDTVSASFYTGVCITEYADNYYIGGKVNMLFKFICGLVTGIDSSNNITQIVQSVYRNGGGGLYPAYFYFFGGHIGVCIGALMLSYIIRKAFDSRGAYLSLLKVALITFVFRWYLYSPVSIYRTLIINFSVMYLVCYIFNFMFYKSGRVLRND